jgi:hypothetical protein
MNRWFGAVAILSLAIAPAFAHRLDEYLQGTIVSIDKNRVNAQMTLTPGVSVFAKLIPDIDTDGDGAISTNEQRDYANRVLRDLSLKIDGEPLEPQLRSMRFPSMGEMKEGRGEIQIEFDADLPPGGPRRKLVLENYHESRISAYQVNCLVPKDPAIKILAQNRNYSQSFYELEYLHPGVPSQSLSLAGLPGIITPLGAIALILIGWLAVMRRRPA